MICNICPRRCGAERTETYGGGFCRMPAVPVIARAGLHLWEEPVLSGTRGSGAVFFSGCSLGCVYCQNHTISAEGVGKAVTTERLREIFRELIAQGAHNIDLITASHFVPFLLPEGKVQIWLPDLKYGLEEPARRYSHAPDYFPVATEAIREMFRQVGPCRMEDGLLRQGVVIRHLVLPGQLESTRRVIDWVARTFRPGEVLFSLMSQYTPQPGAEGPLRRHVTAAEYRAAAEYMENCGIVDGFVQERTSAREEYTPAFDLTGV